MRTIIPETDEKHLKEAVLRFREARRPVALTGAGISVESGIADFRSPGGVWTLFDPQEFATLNAFHRDPEKAWVFYRALADALDDKRPNPAHRVLAELEEAGRLAGVVTQNIDSLHQAAGSRRVIEIHGDNRNLECLVCGCRMPIRPEHRTGKGVPACGACGAPLKPNVVLFQEAVRGLDEIEGLLEGADLMLVVGTSAQVYPAAILPTVVKRQGGLIYEFNLEPTVLTETDGTDAPRSDRPGSAFPGPDSAAMTDFFFRGPASAGLTLLAEGVLGRRLFREEPPRKGPSSKGDGPT